MYKDYQTCRISGSKNLIPFFKLNTALAGGFLKSEDQFATETQFPLTLSFCPDSSLVQVNEVIEGKVLFENYFYKTGTIKTLVSHFESFSDVIKNKFPDANSILEIGCNDFTFLNNFLDNNQFKTVIGVDPSDVSQNNKPKKAILYNTFFGLEVAKNILTKHGKIDLVTTSNSFAHIEDIRSVTDGISHILSPKGVLVVEVHWLGSLIKNLQFPFVYHEHMYYYSLRSISNLLKQFGLEVFDVQHIDIHGGSIRFYCGHVGSHSISNSVQDLINEETQLGLYNVETFHKFTEEVDKKRNETMELLTSLHDKKIYGYGASGQANTLMAYYGITKEHIPYIVDDSPLKVGCYTPNNHIPIVPSEILKQDPPEYILCFAYTFYDEIRAKTTTNAKWIIPLPDLKVTG